jgi:uncharacterized membrane protein YidH (DUF202 family)
MDWIRNYFLAEKNESLFFIIIGTLAVAVGIYFWMTLKKPFITGLAIPLILLGAVEIIVGATVYIRSPKDIQRVETYFQQDISKVQAVEIPRMQAVNKQFRWLRYTEISFMILGLLFAFGFRNQPFWQGFGIALFMQSAVLLSLDYFAERRGIEYLEKLLENR